MIILNKKIMIIINPVSAGSKTAKIWSRKRNLFKRELQNFTEKHTEKPGDAIILAKKAVENNYDYIVAVGGDGTVNEIINGMLLAVENTAIDKINYLKKENIIIPRTKLVIFVQGTGSDLSRSLGLPNDSESLLRLIKKEKTKDIKVLNAEYNLNGKKDKKSTERYFINIADCGMGAAVAKELNNSKKIFSGSLNYFFKIFKTLFKYQNKKVKITADDNIIYQGEINSAVVANGNYFGGGIEIAPEANLFNGKMNLVLLKNFSKASIIFNLIKAYQGKHLSHKLVESNFFEKIRIETKENIDLELDGESVESNNIVFQTTNKAISILVK